ncbi:uncharacterized protein BKCO1_4700075 [Diplodia corticola]|uniref:Tetratricopeptide repeat protein 36 n=1 Tax=Diplodia corticola TaxID=236234 RepID=A0A1J9QU91_9PEZI|nr:uncharacterized protein BKCO1_4700075 [Diplodia corticola]OJD31554.1 hypothetical protein BKCO1_4700075 [Diplodia corticola]
MVSPIPTLSSNDAKVLSALFDRESSSSASIKIAPQPPQTLPHIADSLLPTLQAAERTAILLLNTQKPSLEDANAAIRALNELIEQHPNYASTYANRAQAMRLRIEDEDRMFEDENVETTEALLADLSRAIELASPASPQDPLSSLQARLLAIAHTHRGYLLLKAAKAAGEATLHTGPKEVRGRDKDSLEEMASREFFLGGRYGDKTAKEMAVRTNPYAKMCGAIVKQAMREEMGDAPRIDVGGGIGG